MKIKLVQMNIGSKFRFMPYTASGGNVYNKPRDGWISEAAARKWAMQNGHEIVNVEKISSNGEKIFKFTYTYVNRLGREITKTTELVGKSEADLKQRILDGLKYNGDSFKSWGKVQTKDSVDSIREKYLGDESSVSPSERKKIEDVGNAHRTYIDIENRVDKVAYGLKTLANEFKSKGFNNACGILLKTFAYLDNDVSRSLSKERRRIFDKDYHEVNLNGN